MKNLNVKILVLLFIVLNVEMYTAQNISPVYNTWSGIMYQYKLSSNSNITGDVGYRTYNVLKNRRNLFGRFLIERVISKNVAVGLGYAIFENFSFGKNKFIFENRPFANIQFRIKKEKNELFIRNRNEWRVFENGTKNNIRYRFQFAYEYDFKLFKSRLAYEYLTSSDQNKEHRYTIGVLLPIKCHRVSIFYAINRQSAVKIDNKILNQHVVGFQLQIIN